MVVNRMSLLLACDAYKTRVLPSEYFVALSTIAAGETRNLPRRKLQPDLKIYLIQLLRMKMLGAILLGIIGCTSFVHAQEGEIIVPNNKTQCINDMVQWCDGMQYPQQGAGISMLSIAYEDTSTQYRVLCASDSDGTNCTRNKTPWFSCTPDHILTYKGQILSSNMSTDVDDDICNTADKAFNDLFIQNLSYDNTTLKKEVQKGFEAFFDQIAAMEEQIDQLQRKIDSIPFFRDGFWGGLFDGFLIEMADMTGTVDDKQNITEQINEVKGNK